MRFGPPRLVIEGMMRPMTKTRADSTGPGTLEILLNATSVVCLTIGLSTLGWWLMDRPTSEYPAWIEAGATLAAVGAAIVAGFYAARAFGLEQERDRSREEAHLADQAGQVAAWWGDGPIPEPRPGLVHAHPWGILGPPSGVLLRNASAVPVTAVKITVLRPDTQEVIERFELGVLGPTAEPIFRGKPRDLWEAYRSIPDDVGPVVRIRFRDAAGIYWIRDEFGALRRRPHNIRPRRVVVHRPDDRSPAKDDEGSAS